jgi:hypothetical protein
VLLPALHSRPTDRSGIKLLRMHEGHAITAISIFDNFLVTAASDGFVRFYDFKFRLLAWYEDLDVGPITALTFTSPQMPVKDSTVLESQVVFLSHCALEVTMGSVALCLQCVRLSMTQ